MTDDELTMASLIATLAAEPIDDTTWHGGWRGAARWPDPFPAHDLDDWQSAMPRRHREDR